MLKAISDPTHYQYHVVPGNIDQLRLFRKRVNRLWRNVLVRRSQRARKKWEKFTPVFDRWIPTPRVLHAYPDARFYMVGLDARGEVVVRKKCSRDQIRRFTANLQASLIGMEPCGGAHFLARALREQGHDARLIPAKYVKP